MNAITPIPSGAVALAIPADTTLDAWVALGRTLLDRHRQHEWLLADWAAQGLNQFGGQAEFTALFETVGEPKQLRLAARVAATFPPHLRAADVPFEVHKYIAQLPEERRLETLQKASTEHWGLKKARTELTTFRQQSAMFEDEDQETRLAVEIIRAWNRAPAESREYFWALAERAADNGFGAIDEDEVADA
jgi:hypothetical protein